MSDKVKLIVEIPEGMIKAVEQGCFGEKYSTYELWGCVMHGTPLPKGHGRLIDADMLHAKANLYAPREFDGLFIALKDLKNAPTIIEADEEGEEDGRGV